MESIINNEIVLKERKDLKINGVLKLNEISSEECLLETSLGSLVIKGKELEMKLMDLDKHIIIIIGEIDSISFENKVKKSKGFINKIFK